jgi:dienelactone hydrolase
MSISPRLPRDTPDQAAATGSDVVGPTGTGSRADRGRPSAGTPGAADQEELARTQPLPVGQASHRKPASCHERAEPAPTSRVRQRRRRFAAALVMIVAVVAVVLAFLAGSTGRERRGTVRAASRRPAPHAPAVPSRPAAYAVGLEVLHLVEPNRTVSFPEGASEPRKLETYVRYPALGPTQATDVMGAAPASADGPFPLVVFGHGFDETPETYKLLLQSWARAGFVVVAPVFPLENAEAPGGPDESDLVNQPGDVRYVISRILAESASGAGALAGLVNASEVAVTGQSDGGDTALAVGYDRADRDPRVKAIVVLSGAEGPFRDAIDFPPGSPTLMATQGTADAINSPSETSEFFEAARQPKYLLSLDGAGHLPPYTSEQPQLEIVERVTITFLYAYLEHRSPALRRLRSDGYVRGVSTLAADAGPFSG